MTTSATLAIDGGPAVRPDPMPPRALLGEAEKQAALTVFEDAIAGGGAFGYNGVWEERYERAFCAFMGGGHADGVNSGTNAVYVALGALQLEPFSEVIVPPITDPGGVMPVPLLGCVPVPADCAPGTYNTSAAEIEAVMTERTRAILVAHIGGDMVDMEAVMQLAAAHDVAVVEDCAQAHGATLRGRLAGSFGHLAAFSTMSGKHHCTGAQGGVVYTGDTDLAGRVKRFADRGKPFGLPDAGGNVTAGLNCNSNDLSAAIGLAQLERLPAIIAQRQTVGEALKEGLNALRAARVGDQVPDSRSSYWFVRIRLDTQLLRVDKHRFCEALNAEGIPVGASYRHIPAHAPWFRNRSVFGSGGFPWTATEYKGSREPVYAMKNACQTTDEHFNLAIHENYGPREVSDILDAFTKVETAYRR